MNSPECAGRRARILLIPFPYPSITIEEDFSAESMTKERVGFVIRGQLPFTALTSHTPLNIGTPLYSDFRSLVIYESSFQSLAPTHAIPLPLTAVHSTPTEELVVYRVKSPLPIRRSTPANPVP